MGHGSAQNLCSTECFSLALSRSNPQEAASLLFSAASETGGTGMEDIRKD